jgi:hypothetical protein
MKSISINMISNNQRIRNSIVAIIPACHAGDPSSILGCGGLFYFFQIANLPFYITH